MDAKLQKTNYKINECCVDVALSLKKTKNEHTDLLTLLVICHRCFKVNAKPDKKLIDPLISSYIKKDTIRSLNVISREL